MWLLVLLAVTLALLNPLACVIHCLPRPASEVTSLEGYAAICHIPSPGASQAPATAGELTRGQSQTPQAAYAFIAPLLVVLLVGMRRAPTTTFCLQAAPQMFVRPLAPPPR